MGLDSRPWDHLPDWQARQWSEQDRLASISRHLANRGFDLAAWGRVETVHRTARSGLLARVTVYVIEPGRPQPVWYGTKTADWIRYLPVPDCLFRLAWSFVEEWQPRK